MTAFPSYSTGTISIGSNATAVVGSGSNWTGANAKPGDTLVVAGHQVIIQDVTDATHLAIDAWPFTAVSGGTAYVLYKTSPLRFAGGDAMAQVSEIVGALNTDGFYVFVDPDDTVPDPSLGDENQFAFQPTTFKLWLKTGGLWVLQPSATIGIRQSYSSTTTDADPGAGAFRLNNSTPASATAAYLDNVDSNGSTVSSIFDLWDDSTSTIKGVIRFQKASDPTVWAQFNVTGSVVDGTGYRKLTLASGNASGSFTNLDAFAIAFYRTGDIGSTGAAGSSVGIRQAYSTTTTDSDPGTGTFRLNNSTPASATAAYLDNLDAGGSTVSGILDLWDDSTSTVKGAVRFQKATDPTVWAQFNVTGSVVDGTGYRKLTLANGAGSGSFTNADVFAIVFYRTGNSSAGDMLAANNLSDVANAATAAGNLSAVRYASGQGLSATNRGNARANISAPLAGHLFGMTLSAAGSTGTFGVAAGDAADSTAVDLMTIGSAYTKTTSSWAVGSGNGALDTGSIANSTWYHVYAIKRPDTGVVDVLVSTSVSSPTLPTNYTLFRRIGSMKTDGSAQWVAFSQFGDEFIWKATPALDLNNASITTTRTAFTLSTPLGIVTKAMFRAFFFGSTGTGVSILFSPLFQSDVAPANSASPLHSAYDPSSSLGMDTTQEIWTDTSAQIGVRSSIATSTVRVATVGWRDRRGRDA